MTLQSLGSKPWPDVLLHKEMWIIAQERWKMAIAIMAPEIEKSALIIVDMQDDIRGIFTSPSSPMTVAA